MVTENSSGISRRALFTGAANTVIGSAAGLLLNGCLSFVQKSPVTLLLPLTYDPPGGVSGWWYTRKLRSATINFLQQNHSPNQPFGVWKQPFRDVERSLEERLEEICEEAVASCQKNKSIYPVDPALLVAGMYVESLFYEFAVSSALAVGVAQFIAPTARHKPFNLVCAGDLSEHSHPPYQLPELAGKQREYESVLATLRAYKKNGSQQEKKEIPALEESAQQAKEGFKLFFAANISGRDVLNERDRDFLNAFDQRTISAHAVPSMARYIADSLKARNGNVLAAWSAYNAGLGSTAASGYLKQYGKLPNGDTATYAQKIMLVAEDLNRKIFG